MKAVISYDDERSTWEYIYKLSYAEKTVGKFFDSKKISLEELAGKLDIENPEAHRALADAITTARVFLKLKEMDGGTESASLDDMLSVFEDF